MNFTQRLIGVTDRGELAEMLKTIGVESVEELIGQVIPANIRLKKPLELPQAITESEFAAHIAELAGRNRQARSFIGMGYYPCETPAVIMRNVFENPAWYTSYTPYQAEISQGRLEALLNFQTAVVSMTGMEIANCSLLDEGTAAAEAMAMMLGLRPRGSDRNVLMVDSNIFPQTLDVLMTRAEPFGVELVVDDFATYEFTGKEFGAIVQYPAANGAVRDYRDFAQKVHDNGALLAVAADILSLALLEAPGEWGADIVVGSTQRWGIPMGFGGPSAAYFATKDAYKRSMPGRIIGVSVDRLGNRALRMSLQTREQHIKREKATSNICTASALVASMAGLYAVYNGKEGLQEKAQKIYDTTCAVADALRGMGYQVGTDFFDTLEVEAEVSVVRQEAEELGIDFFYPADGGRVRMSFDELTTAAEVRDVVSIFAAAMGVRAPKTVGVKAGRAPKLSRKSDFLTEPVFKNYHSETELMRYIKRLELRDISLANGMIPLGSCTMKLNAAATMMPLSLSGFGNIHPFAPLGQAEGYMEMIEELERDLCTITGLSACSLQPNSGAAGECAGLMIVRAVKGRGIAMLS